MTTVRLSKTYDDELEKLLQQGLAHYSVGLVKSKRDHVERTMRTFLAVQ